MLDVLLVTREEQSEGNNKWMLHFGFDKKTRGPTLRYSWSVCMDYWMLDLENIEMSIGNRFYFHCFKLDMFDGSLALLSVGFLCNIIMKYRFPFPSFLPSLMHFIAELYPNAKLFSCFLKSILHSTKGRQKCVELIKSCINFMQVIFRKFSTCWWCVWAKNHSV